MGAERVNQTMSYQIVEQVFMLQETISMLYKYVNGITFPELLQQWKLATEENKDDPRIHRLNRLQQIMEQVCAGLDPQNPELRHFFGHVECGCEEVCLAQILTDSFCTLENPGFRAQVEEILSIWKSIQARGCWIQPSSMANLNFSDGPGSPGDLGKQLSAMNYSPKFRKTLKSALEHFEENLYRIAELTEPLSCRLEEAYRNEPQLFAGLAQFWQERFQQSDPLDLLTSLGTEEEKWGAGEETWVSLSLMNTNAVIVHMMGASAFPLTHNCMTIGSAITSTSRAKKRGTDLDSVYTILKCLCDRNRLEILHRLSHDRSYCRALADTTGIDPGNLSRSLSMLYSYGFLRQERGTWRTYYETDRAAIHEFLMRVEEEICS